MNEDRKITRYSKQVENIYSNFKSRLEEANKKLKVLDSVEAITEDEIKQTINNPPQRPNFPFLLAISVSIIEILDLSELAVGFTGIYSFLYGSFRMIVTVYLYYWAYKSIEGVKLVSVKRNLLKNQGRRLLLALLSNAPIPYIGIILRLFPMDLVFVIFTHFDNTKAVQLIWLAIGRETDPNAYLNVIRNKRSGIDKELAQKLKDADKSFE